MFKKSQAMFQQLSGWGSSSRDLPHPGHFFRQSSFFISTGLAFFDVYTAWEVALNFKETGLNNPLLPHSVSVHWANVWVFFAFIGTILTVISIIHDFIDLLYTLYKCCQKRCCSSRMQGDSGVSYRRWEELKQTQEEEFEVEEKDDKEENEEEISDPFKCCFRKGWNPATRAETLGALTLWFKDAPLMTMSVLYVLIQHSCKTPDTKDVTPLLLDVGISVTAAVLASLWRAIRSFVRAHVSLCARTNYKNTKCPKRCLPPRNEAAYPPDTCAHYCLRPFYCSVVSQMCWHRGRHWYSTLLYGLFYGLASS